MAAPDLAADARILWRLLRGQPKTGSHADRLQAFYAPQAERYDAFRARLLHGRQALIDCLDLPPGAHVVELGCGTGSRLGRIGERAGQLARFEMVDLCKRIRWFFGILRKGASRKCNGHRNRRRLQSKVEQPIRTTRFT